MDRATAIAVVSAAWSGTHIPELRLAQALACLGIHYADFRRLERVTASLEIHFPHRFVLTPTGLGRRR